MTTSTADAQLFISYHRPDNVTYDRVVDELKSAIEGRFAAQTGRQLKIFLDRESIPGGGDWREKITQSINTATIFIPVVSMRYFESQACREELLAFHDGAKQLGVTDLILPVILAGRENIKQNDPREEVRLIERLNYRSIEDEVDAGYQSTEWKRAMRLLLKDVAKGLATAESALAAAEKEAVSEEPADAVHPEAGEEGEGPEVGIFDLNQTMEAVTPLGQEAVEALLTFSSDASNYIEFQNLNQMSAQRQRVVLSRAAWLLTPSAALVESTAQKFLDGVRTLDSQLRAIDQQLAVVSGDYAARMRRDLVTSLSKIESMEVAVSQMEDIANLLQAATILSVSLRQALLPAIRGTQQMRDALSIVAGWRSLFGS